MEFVTSLMPLPMSVRFAGPLVAIRTAGVVEMITRDGGVVDSAREELLPDELGVFAGVPIAAMMSDDGAAAAVKSAVMLLALIHAFDALRSPSHTNH